MNQISSTADHGNEFSTRSMLDFSPWEYLLIDAANQWGLDKQDFPARIAWSTDNLDDLEALAAARLVDDGLDWTDYPLFIAAVIAIRKAQAGTPTGHRVGFDAACSGIQIMSVLTGCIDGARATGLVDTDRCADAYADATVLMRQEVPHLPQIPRKLVKQATMCAMYGSTAVPEALFGENGQEIDAFWTALSKLAPGPCTLLETFLATWIPWATEHAWVLPDNFHAIVPVMVPVDTKIDVAELGGVSLPIRFKAQLGAKRGKANAANLVHSVDAYLLRSLVRRCSYDAILVAEAVRSIATEIQERDIGGEPGPVTDALATAAERFAATVMVDAVVFPDIVDALRTTGRVSGLTDSHLQALLVLAAQMQAHVPFDIVTVHDDFSCHPNHMNQLRRHYREIMSELADSRVVEDLLEGIGGVPTGSIRYRRESAPGELAKFVRHSNYGIC